jgi:hypothetical protein
MGSLGGRTEEELGLMATLGGGETIRGDGISVKVIRRGVTWNKGVTGKTIRMVKAEPGGKVLAGAGEAMFDGSKGVATLGSSWLGTLGRPGDGMRAWLVSYGPRSCHDSKRSRRLAMASTWVMVVGGGASLRAPDIT